MTSLGTWPSDAPHSTLTLGKAAPEASAVLRDERYAWVDAFSSRDDLAVAMPWWPSQPEEVEFTLSLHSSGIYR